MRGDELTPARPALAPVTTAASARDHARAVVDACWNASARPAREEDVIDLLLVVSEMVTNAIRHGGGLAGFEVTPAPDGIRLAVHDHSDAVPPAAYGSGALPAGHHGNGYGWPLIIRLARDISIDRRPPAGKTIRVFVPIRTAAPPGSGGPA
ncbi:ATP-binding protein [Streptomyces sp. NPDC017936]|uniref:ATP-binding protein n=1 Tax=Streptomyces sp. NPDC017936 TaxID=3365016 RepID=UPI00379913E3